MERSRMNHIRRFCPTVSFFLRCPPNRNLSRTHRELSLKSYLMKWVAGIDLTDAELPYCVLCVPSISFACFGDDYSVSYDCGNGYVVFANPKIAVALKAENDRTDWKKYIYYLQTNWRRNALWRHKWRGCIVRIMWRSISNRTVFATGNNAQQDAEYSRRKSTKMWRSGSERFWTQSACYFSYSFNSFKNWR